MLKYLEKIKKQIGKSNKILVMFDTDGDGLASYLQIKKYFSNKKILGIPYYHRNDSNKKEYFDSLISNQLKNDKFEILLFLDIPTLEEDALSELSKKTDKIIWIDHHPKDNKDLIKKYNIEYFNPRMLNESEGHPVSYLSYLFSEKKFPNIALIGTVSDYSLYPEIVKKSFLKINTHGKDEDEIKRRIMFEGDLGTLIKIYNFGFKLDPEDIHSLIKLLEKKSTRELLIETNSGKSEVIEKINNIIEEYKQILNKAVKKYKREKIYYFEYRGETSYTSILANELCYKIKGWEVIIVCFVEKTKGLCFYSFRSKKNKIINKIIEKAAEEIGAKGGGHPNACGAVTKEHEKERFIEKIIRNLRDDN